VTFLPIAVAGLPGTLGYLFQQYGRLALWATLGDRAVPGCKLAIGITITAVEDLTAPGFFLVDISLFAEDNGIKIKVLFS